VNQPWRRADRANPRARVIADRHYNRQKPGTPQFAPPGRCLVLLTEDDRALWVTSYPFTEYVQHAWAGAFVNSLFRREGGTELASDLIRSACAATAAEWDPPPLGMVTFIDPAQVRHKRDPGRCYRKAGFRPAGHTKAGLVALQLPPGDFPEPVAAHVLPDVAGQLDLWAGWPDELN
jgi:hypothetical protein